MQQNIEKDIEAVFVNSNSPDELFDAFRVSIENRIKDEELYKILLRNKALSTDEIAMYAEKICSVFPDFCYTIFLCVGQIFQSISTYGKHNEKALKYYKKALEKDDTSFDSYMAIASMYNPDFSAPSFEEITRIIIDGIPNVQIKSKLCFVLVNLYKVAGDKQSEKKYQKLGEQYQKNGV